MIGIPNLEPSVGQNDIIQLFKIFRQRCIEKCDRTSAILRSQFPNISKVRTRLADTIKNYGLGGQL